VRSLAVAFDPEAAADAVQEAFIAADRQWERLASYDDAAAWVRRVRSIACSTSVATGADVTRSLRRCGSSPTATSRPNSSTYVAPSPDFTLRLPGDELYGFDEQTLVIDVPPTDPVPPTTGTVPPRPPDDVGTFPAPAPGDAESHLAPDGSPLWIVRHDDGTASALLAVVPVGNTFGPEGLAVEEAASIVHWSPSSRKFSGSITYDEYGRALNSGRDDDLADFTAVVNGDTVIVQTSGVDRVPGSPETIESSPFSEPVGPALPESSHSPPS